MSQWLLTDSERVALLEFTRALIRMPSISGNEGAVAELVQREMRALGFSDVHTDDAGNVLGYVGAPDGPTLLLNGHLDTVEASDPASWTTPPWQADVRDGRLYGLGAADMKAGLAAIIHGAALLLRRGVSLRGRVLVAGVVLEEPVEGTSTRFLFEEDGIRADWAVIAEPSDLQVVRAQRGHLELILSVKGRSAHSSQPHLGANAICLAGLVLPHLERLAESLPADGFLGAGGLAVTDVSANAASRSAIPDRCDLLIDRRLTLGESEESALAELHAVLERAGIDGSVRIIEDKIHTYTGHLYTARRASPPWAFTADHPLIDAMGAAAMEVGLQPALTKWPFATEGAYTAGVAGIPTVGFGPGSPAVPHTCDEYVDVKQIYQAASAYAALAARLLT